MEYGTHTYKYYEMILSVTKELIVPMMEEDNEETHDVMMNSILGREGPTSIERNTSPYEYYIVNKLFSPMCEVMNSLESIENIVVYAGSFPYRRQGISRATYLKYHVENYLNELYLLKNRLIDYLTLIDRAYKKSEISKHVTDTISPLKDSVTKGLEGYIKVRGVHVHQHRYSDDYFDRLLRLELLSRGDGKDEFGAIMTHHSNTAYREIRKKWVTKIDVGLKVIRILLEFYFENLLIAISKDGKLIIPNNIQKV